MTWEERMAQQARRLGRAGTQPYDHDVPPKPRGEWNLVEGEWLPIPPDQPAPDDGTCTECFEWRRYPPGQEHFGFAWFKICGGLCEHEHHDHEVWHAAPLET